MFVAVGKECVQTNILVKFLYSSVYVMAMAVTKKDICGHNSAPYQTGSLDCSPISPARFNRATYHQKRKGAEQRREERKAGKGKAGKGGQKIAPK